MAVRQVMDQVWIKEILDCIYEIILVEQQGLSFLLRMNYENFLKNQNTNLLIFID